MTPDNTLDWGKLTFGSYSRVEIANAVADKSWQIVRRGLKGQHIAAKYVLLTYWYDTSHDKEKAKIQITNYVNALRRAGMVKKK